MGYATTTSLSSASLLHDEDCNFLMGWDVGGGGVGGGGGWGREEATNGSVSENCHCPLPVG